MSCQQDHRSAANSCFLLILSWLPALPCELSGGMLWSLPTSPSLQVPSLVVGGSGCIQGRAPPDTGFPLPSHMGEPGLLPGYEGGAIITPTTNYTEKDFGHQSYLRHGGG